jgi:SAM-dependent methyltransferase
MKPNEKQAKDFYDKEYSDTHYSIASAENHIGHEELKAFIQRYQLSSKRCLEVGCGRGVLQDLVTDYTGIDLSDSVRQYLHKPFYQSSATELPFEDNEFNAVWTISVLEHVFNPERALMEMRRVIKPGGLLFLHAAWQCRPWAASGFSVRPYRDLDLKGKLIKASVPLRNSVLFRSIYISPKRVLSCIRYALMRERTNFRYKKLSPNYDHFWQSDSDAVNSMDPYEVILWFMSRGDNCITYGNLFSRFFVRTGEIIFQIRK